MPIDFEWPMPPHFELASTSTANNSKVPCIVTLTDGHQKVGKLVRFDQEASILEFRPDRAVDNVRIGFSSVQIIRLTHPIELKRLELPLAAGVHEAPPI
jgi:hypothetical protein